MSTPISAVERPEPPFLAAERESLDTWLEFRRATRSGATGDRPAPRRGCLRAPGRREWPGEGPS